MVWLRKIFFSLGGKERLALFAASGATLVSTAVLLGVFLQHSTALMAAEGGIFTEGIVGQPSQVNPILASSNADKALVRLLFSNLGTLADKVEADKSGKTWRVRIKENVFWSDGTRITSDDVVFTVQKIQDTNTASPLAGSWQGVAVDRASQLEVVFVLANPYAFFSDNIQNLYLLPKHLFADVPVANWRLSEYNLKPVGNGPYVFEAYEKRDDGFITKYRLKANSMYFGDKPYVKNFNIALFANTNDILKSFNAGQISAVGDLDPKNVKAVRRSYAGNYYDLPSYYAVFMNQSEKAAFQDREVRLALNLAVDRDALVRDIFGGKAYPVYDPVPPSFKELPQATSTPFSLDIANTTLENASWKLRGEIREKEINKSFVPLEFKLTVPQIPFLMDTAERLKESWKKIGVVVELVPVAPDKALDQVIKNRDYEAILLGNALNSGADPFSFWHSSERFSPGLNLSLYSNREVDAIIESIRQTFDTPTRALKFQKLEGLIVRDAPAVFLYSPQYAYLTTKNLKGLSTRMLFDTADRFLDVAKWHLKTTRILK